jgi:SAM-dependent methyltransferase
VASYRADIYRRYASVFKKTKARFDVGAADRWGTAYRHYLRRWLPADRQARIVDIGCGGGRLLRFLTRRGYTNLAGVDISLEQVELARQVVPNVTHGDVLDYLESRESSFDLVVGLDIVEHFRKDELPRFFQAIHKSLAPGGRVVLQTPNADTPWGVRVRYADLTHEVCFEPTVLASLLRLYGFRDVECREMGPVPLGYSPTSTLRYVFWRGLRLMLRGYNLIETGTAGSGVHTRVFLASALRT